MTETKTVLLVDDEPDLLRGAEMWLRAAGFQPCMAYNGEEAIDSALSRRPDAIVMDVRMPKKSGLAALDELKHLPETKDIPVIILSASLVDQQRALDAGARFFLTKPYQGKALTAAVTAAIQSANKN